MNPKQKREIKEKLDRLDKTLSKLETHPLVIAYLNFNNLTLREKETQHQTWDMYFKQVYDTPSYMLFSLMSAAVEQGDKEEIARLRGEIVKNKPVLTKPKGYDPRYLSACEPVRNYKSTLMTIKNLQEKLDDVVEEDSITKYFV